jgi:hypothetical protein
MFKHQSQSANINRSNGFKKTASKVKTSGHAKENMLAEIIGGSVVPGTGKTDIKHPTYGNISLKAPEGGKVQMALKTTEKTEEKWGATHAITEAAKAQRDLYADKHLNNSRNEKTLGTQAIEKVKTAVNWINAEQNFKNVLYYALANDTEINYIADMYKTGNDTAYLTKIDDFINGILSLNPVAYVTPSGLRIAVRVDTGKTNKKGEMVTRTAFSFEVRSDAKHYHSLLYKMEGGVIFPLLRNTVEHKLVTR